MLLTRPTLGRRVLAEFCGATFLVAIVVGSGIAAQRLSPNDVGLQLFENAAATAAGLVALILAFGSVSGAHFNPVVSLADSLFGGLPARDLPAYIAAQITGAIAGCVLANLMFSLPAVEWSTTTRSGGGLWLGETVATLGLLLVIFGVVRSGRAAAAPYAVGAYIGAAYFFTSSTSFANPAVTIGRTFTNTFSGIKPSSAPAFIAFELIGAALAVLLVRTLYPDVADVAKDVVVPHEPQLEDATRVPDLNELTPDQRLALKVAAADLKEEFAGTFSQETIELFLTSSFDEFAGRATVRNFLPLLAERFARQRLKALAKIEGHAFDGVPVVLFLCVHNAGRSQMALGWFNHLAGNRAVAWSGGSEPGSEVNPAAIKAMAEVGIDISGEYPKPWTDEIVRAADVVVTMGCGDACPFFPGKRYEDWELDDPAGLDIDAVRPIRDEIRARVETLLNSLGVVAV